jgi:NAD(P)H-dependent FMN reductase
VILISGSTRAGSTNGAVLRTASAVAPAGIDTELYEALATLPHFNPDHDAEGARLDPAVVDLRARLEAADAAFFSTPEYAGDLPGSFKNLLDWTVGGGQTYGMPVGWVNAASVASPNGARDTYASLGRVLGYTGARIVEAACIRLPLSRADVGGDGLIAEPGAQAALSGALAALQSSHGQASSSR